MKALFSLVLAAALGLAGIPLLAAEPSLPVQIAVEVERLRKELEPAFRGQAEGELEKAVQARARGFIARRLFADGVSAGDTNKLNEAVKLDAAVGKPAYFQSAAIKGLPPIYEAVERGNPAVVAWLLERKSPVDFTAGSILEDRDYTQYRRHFGQQPLQIAARNVRLEIMQLILKAGANPTPGTPFPGFPSPATLLLEPFHGYRPFPNDADARINAVQLLLQYGADLFSGQRPSQPLSPVGLAIQSGRSDLLDGLLTNSRPATIRDASGNTLLHYATALGRTNAVTALLANGGSGGGRAVNGQGATPLQVAEFGLGPPWPFGRVSNRPDLQTVSPAQKSRVKEQLLAAGAKWDPFTAIKLGLTNELAAQLKERPALVHDQFGNQGTPLHSAALHAHAGVINLLLQHQAPLDAVDRVAGHTPLHTALFHGRIDVVKLLLKAGAPVSFPDAAGNTPLHLAATRWAGKATEALLAYKPELNVTNHQGQTALDLAARQGLVEMVDLLTKAGAQIRVAAPGASSLLHSAAERGNLDLIRLALEQKLPVDARDPQGRTPFWCAIEKSQVEAAHLLLEAAADINARDTNGATALHWRVRHGNDPIPDPMPAPGFSRAGAAERSRDVALAAALPPSLRPTSLAPTLNPLLFLLENQADAGATNFAGQTPLHDLPQTGNNLGDRVGNYTRYISRAVELLLRYGAKLEITDTNGATPLHLAAQRGNLLHTYALLAHGAKLEARDLQGRTPLMLTAQANLAEVSNYLITAGADPVATDAAGNTLLHLLCANLTGIHSLPTNLVAHAKFPELVQLTNGIGSSPLHLALLNPSVLNPPPFNRALVVAMPWGLQTNHPPSPTVLLEGLLDASPPLDFTGTNGQTYAHLIASSTADAAFKRIESALSRVIPVRRELLDRADRDGNTALHLAAARNHLPLATLLLVRGADPNLTNHAGHTPLLLGYLNFLGHQFPPGSPFDPLGQLLLKHGARLDIAGKEGRTPLQVAVADFRGVPASLRPEGATKDLFKALDEGDAASLKAWLRADPTLLRARRHQHEGFPTLLHEAAQRQPKDFGPVFREAVSQPEPFQALAFGWADILCSVLRSNAGFAKEEIQGRPALHWAAGSRNVDTVRAVLDANADVQATDVAGQTALSPARAKAASDILELLLARGLRVTVFDCLATDDLAGLSELLQHDKALANAQNRQGQPALLVAVATGKLPLAELLLASGADAKQGRVFNPPPGALGAVVVRFAGGLADSPLPAAVAAGDLPMTLLLLRHGADANQALPTRFTLLHQVVAAGNVALAELLLEHGADANAQHVPAGEAKPAAPLTGDTPLHTAARTGRTNVMHLLLQQGARLEATNSLGQTPLGAVLYPSLDAPAAGEVGQMMSGFGIIRMGGFRPVTPSFPAARPAADFLRQQGAKRADPPAKGSWREALEPQKVHHPAGPLPGKDTPL